MVAVAICAPPLTNPGSAPVHESAIQECSDSFFKCRNRTGRGCSIDNCLILLQMWSEAGQRSQL